MNQVSRLSVLVLSGALSVSPGLAFCQSASPAGQTDGVAQPPQTIPGQTGQASSAGNSDAGSYATGKPLAGQSKEGFWGKVNPFARKRWVNRQVDPIKDRTNELDQLQAKNANDIRDVDSRSQAGINRAMASANTADQHAADARSRADSAQGMATDASNRTNSLTGTINNLDQYQTVAALPVVFAPGRTTLGPKGKAQLDSVAARLANGKGYIIEIQAYSQNGVQASQAMADSVARYLVTEHQVPIYRIYKTGLGKSTLHSAETGNVLANGVMVSLMHNSLSTMGATNASMASPAKAAATGVSVPNEN